MLVFLSCTLFTLYIKTKRNFGNQNKGQITFKIFTWGRMRLAMSSRTEHRGKLELPFLQKKQQHMSPPPPLVLEISLNVNFKLK